MLYKINAMGYFGGVFKVSRGPWFREYFVEEDGLDWYYSYKDQEGNRQYLLSNNMALQDREAFSSLYKSQHRNNRMSWFVGLALGTETVMKVNYFKNMAVGWKVLNLFALGWVYKSMLMQQSSAMYGPCMRAYLRKYASAAKQDVTEIEDDKRKYFYIDTSEYMNYSNKDLGDEFHAHHGPQPEGEALTASW
jgi:hypothetical protein